MSNIALKVNGRIHALDVDASTPLTVTSGGTTTTNLDAATTIMSGVISGNSGYDGSSTSELFSNALLSSLQNLSLGG